MLLKEFQDTYSEAFPFWKDLSVEEQNLFCTHTIATSYQKGQNIHGGNEECTGGILVKSGCIRAYILSEDGREITLYRLYAKDICMLSASCVLKAITFDIFVDAEEDSDVLIISGKVFSEIADKNVYVENFALNSAVNRFSDVMWVMQQILFMSLDKRLAIFLYDETIKNNDLDIHLTQEQIAKYMGSAREVVSRMLKYFASEGIVSLYRGGIKIIDKNKLKSLAVQHS